MERCDCGNEPKKGDSFCRNCGKEFPNKDSFLCECGADVEMTDNFCHACGSKFDGIEDDEELLKKECSTCGGPY